MFATVIQIKSKVHVIVHCLLQHFTIKVRILLFFFCMASNVYFLVCTRNAEYSSRYLTEFVPQLQSVVEVV